MSENSIPKAPEIDLEEDEKVYNKKINYFL